MEFPFYSTITGVIFILFVAIPLFLISLVLFRLAVTKERGIKFWRKEGGYIKSFWVHDEEE